MTTEPREFLRETETLLRPVYAECFSDYTRNTRTVLLILSFVLILSSLGMVSVGATNPIVPSPATATSTPAVPSTLTVLGMPVVILRGFRWGLVAVCLYLLAVHSARSYSEWKLWRLRHQAPLFGFQDLIQATWAELNDRYETVNTAFEDSAKLLTQLLELTKEPAELGAARARLLAFSQGEVSHFDLEEFLQLSREIDRLKQESEARVALRRGDLERRLAESQSSHQAQAGSPELKALRARLDYLKEAIQPARRALKATFALEIVFPTVFAVVSIVIGLVM